MRRLSYLAHRAAPYRERGTWDTRNTGAGAYSAPQRPTGSLSAAQGARVGDNPADPRGATPTSGARSAAPQRRVRILQERLQALQAVRSGGARSRESRGTAPTRAPTRAPGFSIFQQLSRYGRSAGGCSGQGGYADGPPTGAGIWSAAPRGCPQPGHGAPTDRLR